MNYQSTSGALKETDLIKIKSFSMEKNIYTQLLEFQKLGISIKKDSVGGHHKNKYASVDEVLEKVKKALNGLDVVVVQSPKVEGLRTRLIHPESRTWVESTTPFVGVVDMQKLGGAITYARRYSLVSMLGLEAEDDDLQEGHDKEKSVTPAPIRR